jgi:hypothetical protein
MTPLIWRQAVQSVHLIQDQYAGRTHLHGDGICMMSCRKVGHTNYISFRGSSHLKDWLRNLSRDQVNSQWGRVHGGVKRSLDKNLGLLYQIIQPRYFEHYVLCGHSAGGAYAQLMAGDMLMSGVVNPSHISILTFGSQLVGDETFKTILGHRIQDHYNFVYESDPVPGLPRLASWDTYIKPWKWLGVYDSRYRSTGQMIWFNGKKWTDNKGFFSSVKTFFTQRARLLGDFFHDHMFDNYFNEVARAGSTY